VPKPGLGGEPMDGMTASVEQSSSGRSPMSEVAEDTATAAVEMALQEATLPDGVESLRAEVEQLKAELASARSEIEFAAVKETELETRVEDARATVASLKEQVRELEVKLKEANSRPKMQASESSKNQGRAEHEQRTGLARNTRSSRELQLEEECRTLRSRVSLLEARCRETVGTGSAESPGLGQRQTPAAQGANSGQDQPLLTAAYQQISVLNTELAHLYTELTLARTEAKDRDPHSTSKSEEGAGTSEAGPEAAEELHKSHEIASLVSDIKHLQLDLEYHQQKLDQMLEEKQLTMKELKKCQTDLKDAKLQVEERDQQLKHKDVDLQRLKTELRSPRMTSAGTASQDGQLSALRAEAAAKDSALIVSHYELHKEKLLRDRLEQKNLKLMERMQKLMMVVETMRKDNVMLERSIAAKDRLCEDKDQQMRNVMQKAKLQRASRVPKLSQRGSVHRSPSLELEGSPSQGLPPLMQNSVDSGRRSGTSTPRTPHPPSPYGSR